MRLIFQWSVNDVESLVALWEIEVTWWVDQMIVFWNVEDLALITEVEGVVESEEDKQAEGDSVWGGHKEPVSLVMEVVFFFQVDVISWVFVDQVLPSRSKRRLDWRDVGCTFCRGWSDHQIGIFWWKLLGTSRDKRNICS